ncbi:hypothetical protein [Vibrio europaeus]|uniref:Uncharacterized protein n=1 Tax=Vibrio europaeus TaxID=300876 RepID=A0A178J5R7_9VIBR|nr:hypothetical protein [Vibrio europaeus]MDC5706164.1 hypothetical protein [Vibrio europaeus]MDC5709574.1 hypothetical protein [Vibrio europaeus]MDC5713973.1 hypothetical protein [Vibrio europaeus]MDC5723418.1 hypothetical protein [Vibrio europaeus]MDC5730555.1 hypothetical protein [Vibrio europaeus]
MEHAKNQLKILKTRDFLKEIINSPKQYKDNNSLLKQLKSQGGLAKFESQERNIESCALNTFKTNADETIRGGFDEIDRLRKNAVNAIEFEIKGKKTRKGNVATAIGQKNRIKEQAKEIEALQRDNLILTALIREARSKMKAIAVHKGTKEARWELYLEMNNQIQNASDLAFEGEL